MCKSVSLHQLLAGSLIFFLIWINIDLLFDLIPNGDEYREGKWVVFILGFSRLLNSTLSVGCTVLNYSKYYFYSLVFTVLLTVTAIFLNVKLIPYFGMYGAASASLAAYAIYFVLLLWVVWKTIRVNPFSMAQVKVCLVMMGLFGINLLWYCCLTPHVASTVTLALLEALVRSLLLLLAAFFTVYKFGISDDVNRLIDKYILRKS